MIFLGPHGLDESEGEAMTPTFLLIALAQLDGGPVLMVPEMAPMAQSASVARPVNLLAGLTPRAEKTANPERMNDGQATDPGDGWQSVLTSVMEKDGSVTWDLGATRDWEGAWIEADNNDVYMLSSSDDGQNFTTVWESSTVDNAGMQIRTSTNVRGHGRFVKLTAKGGDGMFSVGELAIFATGPEAKAYVPNYVRNPATPQPQPFDGNWIVIAVVLAGIVVLVRRMKPPDTATATADGAPSAEAENKNEPPPTKG
jgi:hypothetical protein